MRLSELFASFTDVRFQGDPSTRVSGISIDSRQVRPGDLYVVVKGSVVDGVSFVPEAIANGAVALAGNVEEVPSSIPVARVRNPRSLLGELSARVYGHPSLKLRMVGITGTNGKTTTAKLVEAILGSVGRKTGFVGTLGYAYNEKTHPAIRTTPEAPVLHRMLKNMLETGTQDVVMECSSHGLEMGRLNAVHFDVALFTNLSPEHLDFHPTMQAYENAKWKLFSEVLPSSEKKKKISIFNLDDPVSRRWIEQVHGSVWTYGVASPKADISVESAEFSLAGCRAEILVAGVAHVLETPLMGRHNLSNALAALSIAHVCGVDTSQALVAIQGVSAVDGRLERVPNQSGVAAFVDYAHTEDALKNIFSALRPVAQRRIIAVFGCGGNRDRQKRPAMAHVGTSMADLTILTSDNPRREAPQSILEEMMAGVSFQTQRLLPEQLGPDTTGAVCSLVDRREAIECAVKISAPQDVLLIAGKGHETYQEIAGVRNPFDDRLVAQAAFGEKEK